jgi:hypothetical protein
VLHASAAEWAEFLATVKNGKYDHRGSVGQEGLTLG